MPDGTDGAKTAADIAFERLGARYVDESPALSPVSATGLGDHRFDDRLDDVSPQSRAARVGFCTELLAELEAMPARELSRANQVDAALLAHRLRAQVWQTEALQEWAWNPMAYTGLAGSAVYTLTAREFAPLADRLRSAAARLEQFPRLMEQVRATLEPPRVPKVHAETAVKQNRGVIGIMTAMLAPHLDDLGPADRSRLVAAMESAKAAVEAQQTWLEDELLPNAAGEFRLGAALYDRKLAFALHSPLSRGEIREQAEAEMARVREEMYEIAIGVYCKEHPYTAVPANPSPAYRQAIIRAGLERACLETPDPKRMVEQATECLERLTTFVRADGLVTVPPDPVEIIPMPEFRRGTSLAYCDSPGPLDVGQRTFYAISPIPDDWTGEQVRSLLREYNLRSLTNLTAHEAMPGHFLQLTHANRYPSTLRAMLSSGPFIEGWAIYGEHVLVERGAYGEDPLMRLVVLKWLLRAISNAILDQAVHVDGMEREEAMRLMREQTFQEEREAAGKWTRAQLTSAQLSTYFVGYLEHTRIRRAVEAAWGADFDLRNYHDRLLSYGSPAPQYARALMLDEPIGR